ncbi:MAG: hypothetical protein ACMG55_11975, partial [Microcoleus sp.]
PTNIFAKIEMHPEDFYSSPSRTLLSNPRTAKSRESIRVRSKLFPRSRLWDFSAAAPLDHGLD